jgi:hypothetical protein
VRLPAVLTLLLVLGGCRTVRTLEITSDPAGAEVRLDDERAGYTPVRIPFEHYGIRRLTLHKPGYRTHSERLDLDAPWYFQFPLDLVSEVLLPIGLRDRRVHHVDLVQGEEVLSLPSLRSVIDRANVLRESGPEGPRFLPETRPTTVPPLEEEAEGDELPPERGG